MVAEPVERIDRHKDGMAKAKGHTINSVLTGYGSGSGKTAPRMRSGYFENGKPTGERTTYDARGKVVKTMKMKPPH
jgi:antitoxin component YwqK of YwqJK toxin-antitoxin module